MKENRKDFNQKNFVQEVLSSKLALIDFWCSWCLPSQSEKNTLEELAQEYKDTIKVGVVNVDMNPILRERYNIKGIPTFILFKEGKEIKREIGAKSKKQLISIIEEVL